MLSFWRELFVIKFMSQFKFQIIFLPKFSTIFICFKLRIIIVGKGGQPPFSNIPPPFLEIQDVPTFYRPIRKTKVLNDSFNWFIYNFYPQSILILEEYLQKWWNANYEKWVSIRQRNIKLLLETVTYIATTETATCIIIIKIVMRIMHCRK